MSDDIRKFIDIVESNDLEEGFWSDMFGKGKEKAKQGYSDYKDKRQTRKQTNRRREFGQDRSDIIDMLADKIEQYGFEEQALKFLNQNDKMFSKESIEEKVITDKGIKQVLVQIAKTEAGLGNDEADAKSNKSSEQAMQYVTKWQQSLDKAYNNMRDLEPGTQMKTRDGVYQWAGAQWQKQNKNGKFQPVSVKRGDPSNMELTDLYMKRSGQDFDVDGLTKEMVAYLADRKGQPEWKEISRKVKQTISKYANREEAANVIDHIDHGEVMEAIFYHAFSTLLKECGATWFNLGWKPTALQEGYVIMSPCVPNRNMLLEDFLTDVVMYDKIAQLKNKHKG